MVHTEYEVFALAKHLFPQAWKIETTDGLWKVVRVRFFDERHGDEIWHPPDISLGAWTWKKVCEKLRQAHVSLQAAEEG